ncbi:MAG: hypothetical protein ACHQ9S_22460 [Candidatus Binatia bacterium]
MQRTARGARDGIALTSMSQATGDFLLVMQLNQEAVGFLLWREGTHRPSPVVTQEGATELKEVTDESEHR